MLVGMGAGAIAGAFVGEAATSVAFVGEIFIRLLVLAAVPLMFANLVGALAGSSPAGGAGRLLAGIGAFFLLTTVAAQVVSLGAVGILRPGDGMAAALASAGEPVALPSGGDFLDALIPDSVLGVFVDGRVTGIVVLGLMLGAAARRLERAHREAVVSAFDALTAWLRMLVRGILWTGPVGVAALAAAAVGEHGEAVFGPLGLYIGAVWAADLAMFGLYLGALRIFASVPATGFLRRTATVWTTTISTCSSLASLSASLNTAERIGIPRRVYAVTLPLGAQLNKDGSAVLLAGAVLFTAQAAGAPLGWADLAAVVLFGALLSAAAPGVPNGGIVNQLLLLTMFGLPLELGVLVAGVYRLVDMPTTTLNIMGDLVGTLIVARGHREVDPAAAAG